MFKEGRKDVVKVRGIQSVGVKMANDTIFSFILMTSILDPFIFQKRLFSL